jgi:hypothetical protein
VLARAADIGEHSCKPIWHLQDWSCRTLQQRYVNRAVPQSTATPVAHAVLQAWSNNRSSQAKQCPQLSAYAIYRITFIGYWIRPVRFLPSKL